MKFVDDDDDDDIGNAITLRNAGTHAVTSKASKRVCTAMVHNAVTSYGRTRANVHAKSRDISQRFFQEKRQLRAYFGGFRSLRPKCISIATSPSRPYMS